MSVPFIPPNSAITVDIYNIAYVIADLVLKNAEICKNTTVQSNHMPGFFLALNESLAVTNAIKKLILELPNREG